MAVTNFGYMTEEQKRRMLFGGPPAPGRIVTNTPFQQNEAAVGERSRKISVRQADALAELRSMYGPGSAPALSQLPEEEKMRRVTSIAESANTGQIEQPQVQPVTPEIDYAAMETDQSGGTPFADRAAAQLGEGPERTGIFQVGQEITQEQLGTRTQAPLQSGEIQTPDFRGTLEDYRAFRQAQDQERQAGIERNRESFRGAMGGAPTETAIQIGDKREMDRRMASINAMEEGPEKQDALARVQDEATAKQAAGVKDTDRFTGSIGSPDHKAREGRMADYQKRLDQLTQGRVISKREAQHMAKENRAFEMEEKKIADAREVAADKNRIEAERNTIMRESSANQLRLTEMQHEQTMAKLDQQMAIATEGGAAKELERLRKGYEQEQENYTNSLMEQAGIEPDDREKFGSQYAQGLIALKMFNPEAHAMYEDTGADQKRAIMAAMNLFHKGGDDIQEAMRKAMIQAGLMKGSLESPLRR